VPDSDNETGNLYRVSDRGQKVFWKCEAHAHQRLSSQSLKHLKEFIHGQGGHLDMQQATIRVELGSIDEADQFRIRLSEVKYIFDVSIKLNWIATRSNVKALCLDIGKTGTSILELDGITLDINSQGYDQFRRNLFCHDIIAKRTLRCITLLNYPRPQERCIHINYVSLQISQSSAQSFINWVELAINLEKFCRLVFEAQEPSHWSNAAAELQSTLMKHGLLETYMVTLYNDGWDCVFDRKTGSVVEVHSEDMVCPRGVLSSGSIRMLSVHLNSIDFDQELFNTMRANTELQDLYVSYYGHNMLYHTEHIVRWWHESSSPFRLTLLDRMEDTHGRIVAHLSIRRGVRKNPSSHPIDFQECDTNRVLTQQQHMDELADIAFKQWDCDHIFSPQSDYSAALLDKATKQHPSVLTLLTLDVSQLSHAGLSSVREVLRRSDLEHLHVVCTPVNSQSESITQVLGAIRWSTLKSLVFAGNNIKQWIDHCLSPFSPNLLSLQIQGTWSNIQELSHSNVLFIHQLISASPIVELCFLNVQLQEVRDWTLLVESIDFSMLKTLDLGTACTDQLVSTSEAANLFISGIEQVHVKAEETHMVLKTFTLNITALSQSDLARFQKILNLCRLQELHIKCLPFDPRLSHFIAQMLAFVHWPSLERLDLTGDNINAWIQFLPTVEIPRLQSLSIQGSERVEQTLAHSSVLFAEQCIRTSPLVELNFGHVQLQGRRDWVRLVESMDPLMVRRGFNMAGKSCEQFMATPEAVKLEQEKRAQ